MPINNQQSTINNQQSTIVNRSLLRQSGVFPAALVSLWSEDDEHLVPFHLRPCFDLADVCKILFELLQNARTQFAVGHFTTAKPDGGFYFVALLQPLPRMLHAVIVIVVVGAGSKLNFL